MRIEIEVNEVDKKDNRKIMYDQQEIASGTFGGGDVPFKLLGTDNHMSHTLIVGDTYYHVHTNDIIQAILSKLIVVSK